MIVSQQLNGGEDTATAREMRGAPPPASVMASTRRRRLQRWLIGVAVALGVGSVASRPPLLRAIGHMLVIDQAVDRADVIVLAVDSAGAGVLEAADLVHAGVASRVAVFEDPPDAVDEEFIRRGAPYEDGAERSERQLRSLGITAVERIGRAAGSEEETVRLPEWCSRQNLAAVVVVTTPDHSHRLYRMLQRSMAGHRTAVKVRMARHATFDPESWWQTRGGLRIGIIELQKLLLDVVSHPFS
jgi:microcompartment protein CcmK/EutM